MSDPTEEKENVALYSCCATEFPHEEMLHISEDVTPTHGMTERGMTYEYSWPDLKVIVASLDKEKLPAHLNGFAGYVNHIYKGNIPPRGQAIVERILGTKMVIGIEIQPGLDDEGRAEEIVGCLCGGFRPIMFCNNALFDWQSRLLLGPDQSFDPESNPEEEQDEG